MEKHYNSYEEYKKNFEILPIMILAMFISDAFFFSALLIIFQEQNIGTVIYLAVCAMIFIPILWKFIRAIQRILQGVKRKYLRCSLYSFGLYLGGIIVTVAFNGSIKGKHLFLCTGLIMGEGMIIAVARGYYFLEIMRRFYPFTVEKNFSTNDAEKELYEGELECIYNSTNFPEVVKALELRQASSVVVAHILIPFFTVESLMMLGVIR